MKITHNNDGNYVINTSANPEGVCLTAEEMAEIFRHMRHEHYREAVLATINSGIYATESSNIDSLLDDESVIEEAACEVEKLTDERYYSEIDALDSAMDAQLRNLEVPIAAKESVK
jgi:hypothetical protein